MPCPSCGSSAPSKSCPDCSAPPVAWASNAFDSWGSSSAEWDGAVRTPPPTPAANSGPQWGGGLGTASPVAGDDVDDWGPNTRGVVAGAVAKPLALNAVPGDDDVDGWCLPALSPPAGDLESEEAWLDFELPDDDVEDYTSSLSPAPADGGRRGLWWVSLALTSLLLLAGLWMLQKPAAAPAPEKAKLAAAASLKAGRLLVKAGETSLRAKDAELAASQIRAALPQLKAGKAAKSEIQETRRLLARALAADHQYAEVHAVWKGLRGEVPGWKGQAEQEMKRANGELRKKANASLLKAEAALKSGRFRDAEALAEESLALFSKHNGNAAQLGMAHGALGYANLRLGRTSTARQHLTMAKRLRPNGPYAQALQSLGPATSAEMEAMDTGPAASLVPVVVDASAQAEEPSYPTAVGGAVAQPGQAPVQAPVPGQVVSVPIQTRPPAVVAPRKPAAPAKVTPPNTTFDMTDKSLK